MQTAASQTSCRPGCGPAAPRAAPRRRPAVAARAQQPGAALTALPSEYPAAVRQAQMAIKAAIADGVKLLEVEVPTLSLTASQGDGEGMNEMNASMDLLARTLAAFGEGAEGVRVFFPDQQELAVARSGQTMDPSAGRAALDPKFEDSSRFKFGYLTKQNMIWSTLGVNFGQKFSPADLVKDSDKLFVVAYPSFNPREELSATFDLWKREGAPKGRPLIVFNGELDRIRGGYYPGFAFGELSKLGKEFIPQFEAAYYIRNFKGTRPGALFRCYPGPWQVLRRNPLDDSDARVVWTGERRPTLREVAMDILPGGGR
ncbi:low PSII accumulation, chloroplastic [Raphidocelis subcapitata]|uniref:Low PSII accumulation, chloroplastic n=1 Tax=Raphidocelis subcapitata TaxID=307507 RepID=A0A2V0NSB8_9CHLO|nr:low PSII accumulation, chloroplastic [Raphidocelis subcapitata]|eukprot:GBF90219.1 low PSII accumulation, chloroplastic [Raphidocelis subcapitata]